MIGKVAWLSVLYVFIVTNVQASVMFTEILADPPSGLAGDANQDGVTSSIADEFIEIYNNSPLSIDLSGWSISDSVRRRHIFSIDSIINPFDYFVVFGGGSPFTGQTASTGSLGLNNSGDTISLFDKDLYLVDQMTYGSIGGRDQSMVLSGAQWVLILESDEHIDEPFSPGAGPFDNRTINETSTVPEAPSVVIFLLGLACLALIKMPALALKQSN